MMSCVCITIGLLQMATVRNPLIVADNYILRAISDRHMS